MTDGTFAAILPEVARRVAHNSQWLESKTLAAVQSLRAAAFFYVLKLGDLDGSFRELGGDF